LEDAPPAERVGPSLGTKVNAQESAICAVRQVTLKAVKEVAPFAIQKIAQLFRAACHPGVVEVLLPDAQRAREMTEKLLLAQDHFMARAEEVVLKLVHGLHTW